MKDGRREGGMKGKHEAGTKGRKRRRKKDEEEEKNTSQGTTRQRSAPVSLQVALGAGAEGSGPGLSVTSSRRAASRVPALCNRVALIRGPSGGSRSPWVAASPLAFGFLPGQPRWRQEGDNCPETQHLSGPVVQGAQEGGPRAAALTPQRLGMRAGATGERGSQGAPLGAPAGAAASLLGKERPA